MYFISIKSLLNKRRASLVGILLTPFFTIHATAQLRQSALYEYKLTEDELAFEVAPVEDKGVFLYRRFTSQANDALELYFLDTACHQKWHGFLPLEKNYIITRHRVFNNSLFFIQRYRDFSKNDMQIIALDHEHGTFVRYLIRNFIPFSPTEFYVTKKAALFGGYFNRTPVVIYFDFATQQSKIVPGLFNEPGELTQIKTYADDSFDILVSAQNRANKKTLWIRNYSAQGDILKNVMLDPQGENHLIFGRSIRMPDDQQIISGTYSNNSREFSKGIFIATIDGTGNQQVHYYNYGELENFFKFMRARQEMRVKSRIARRKIKGRKLRFSYRLMVHDILPYQGRFIMLGEAFYPKYIYRESYGMFSSFSGSYGRFPRYDNGRIFDGYYYTHAVVIGFDKQGKLIWDNAFEINDVKTFTLEQFVKLDPEEDKIKLLYLFDNEIRSKLIKDNAVLEGKNSAPLRIKNPDGTFRKKDVLNSKLEFWFPGSFIAYGTRWVNDKRYSDGRRKVFFINRIDQR